MRFHARRRPGLGEEEDKEEEGDISLSEGDINHIPADMREYRVASTQARVTLASAKPLLYMFCSKLPSDRSAPNPTSYARLTYEAAQSTASSASICAYVAGSLQHSALRAASPQDHP